MDKKKVEEAFEDFLKNEKAYWKNKRTCHKEYEMGDDTYLSIARGFKVPKDCVIISKVRRKESDYESAHVKFTEDSFSELNKIANRNDIHIVTMFFGGRMMGSESFPWEGRTFGDASKKELTEVDEYAFIVPKKKGYVKAINELLELYEFEDD